MQLKRTRKTREAYYLKDTATGDKFRVVTGFVPSVYVNNGKDGVFDINSNGMVFDSNNREWIPGRETYFYPDASPEQAAMVNELFEFINNLPKRKA